MIIKSELDQIRPIPGDPPPPYTAIEFGTIDNLEQPATAASSYYQFCRLPFDDTKDQSWSDDDTDTVPCCPGLQEIQAGGQQIIDSGLLLARTSLTAAGGVVQGLGKIMIGLGQMMAYRRT